MINENARRKISKSLRIVITVTVVFILVSRLFYPATIKNKEDQSMGFPFEKFNFIAGMLGFTIQFTLNGEKRVGNTGPMITVGRNQALFEEFILVRSEADAHGFPENVVVAWPDPETPFYQERLDRLNRVIAVLDTPLYVSGQLRPRPGANYDLEKDFGLTYPITVDDIFVNWKAVRDLMRVLVFW